MPAKKIITTVGLIIIFLSLGIGAYFVYQKGLLTTFIDDSIKPTKVRISNVSSDSFTVSWVTQAPTQGSIIYGTNKLEEVALDDRDQLTGQSGAYTTHHVTLKNLNSATQYDFKLRSGDKDILFDNEGKNFFQKTAPNLGTTPTTDMINGRVLDDNNSPSDGVLVYVNIAGVSPLSALTKKDGSWLLNLSSARNSQLTNYANYDLENSLVEIFVQTNTQSSSGKTVTANKSPVPDIVLGTTFDFTSEEAMAQSIPDTPIVEQNIGMGQDEDDQLIEEETLSEEEFEDIETDSEATESALPEQFPQTLTKEPIIIEIPAYSGEQFTNASPTFSGTGEPGTVITVEIDGNHQGSAITVNSEGQWQFTPTSPLTAGNHVLTLTYINSDGDETTVEEDFSIVLGARTSGSGGIPQEEASPSALTTPTPTPVVRSSMPSTASGTPESGVNLPTMIMLILGSSLIVIGLQWKKLFS